MSTISPTPNDPRQAIVDQYKNYFKNMTAGQDNASALLNAFTGTAGKADGLFKTGENQNWVEDFFNQEASTRVSINTEAVRGKLWDDLENKVKYYEAHHPEIKGKYAIALNPSGADGVPAFTVADKADVLGLVNEKDHADSDTLITDHPVQVFTPSNVDVRKLKGANLPGLEAVVAEFLAHNQGVFQFLESQPSAATPPVPNQPDSLATYLA